MAAEAIFLVIIYLTTEPPGVDCLIVSLSRKKT
jgi:hypothetical protein